MLMRIFNSIGKFLIEFGKARAASHLARMGKYKEAQAVMSGK